MGIFQNNKLSIKEASDDQLNYNLVEFEKLFDNSEYKENIKDNYYYNKNKKKTKISSSSFGLLINKNEIKHQEYVRSNNLNLNKESLLSDKINLIQLQETNILKNSLNQKSISIVSSPATQAGLNSSRHLMETSSMSSSSNLNSSINSNHSSSSNRSANLISTKLIQQNSTSGNNNNTNTNMVVTSRMSNNQNLYSNHYNNHENSNNRDRSDRDRDRDGRRNGRPYNKSRDNKKEDILILQRPTILAKPSSSSSDVNKLEQENGLVTNANTNAPNKITIIRNSSNNFGSATNNIIKDENSKPFSSSTSTDQLNRPVTKLLIEPNKAKDSSISNSNKLTVNNGPSRNSILILNPTLSASNTNFASKPKVAQNQTQQPVKEISSTLQVQQTQQQQQQVQQNPVLQSQKSSSITNSNPISLYNDSIYYRLSTLPFMTNSVKLLDENLTWQDNLQEYLLENNDYLVIGVLGKKGVGKSTLMSMLAGSNCKSVDSNDIFKVAAKDVNGHAQHKTSGINAFITNERTILLDVQPLLSASLLDKAISMGDKKHLNSDFKYYENYIEIQSIELACFVLSVCNVVLLTEDWFTDTNLLRLLQTAEMLLPNMNGSNISAGGSSTSTSGSSSSSAVVGSSATSGSSSSSSTAQLQQLSSGSDDVYENHPHLIYILNKSDYLSKLDLIKMKSCFKNLMKDSKLIFKGSIHDQVSHNSGSLLSNNRQQKKRNGRQGNNEDADNVNFVVLPRFGDKENELTMTDEIKSFNGLPSMDRSIKNLLRELLAVKRNQSSFTSSNNQQLNTSTNANVSMNNQSMSEKRWFLYASKVWDTIRKSPLISEYNRLMT